MYTKLRKCRTKYVGKILRCIFECKLYIYNSDEHSRPQFKLMGNYEYVEKKGKERGREM
jgi:hypothetical protein